MKYKTFQEALVNDPTLQKMWRMGASSQEIILEIVNEKAALQDKETDRILNAGFSPVFIVEKKP